MWACRGTRALPEIFSEWSLHLFTMEFKDFLFACTCRGTRVAFLAWLAKPLKCCNFGFCGLIELKSLVNGLYNFLQWNLRFWHVPMQGRVCPAWPGWLNL